MCPHLSVTPVGLVRHISTVHAGDPVEAINKAFGGVKTFGQCPHCPEKFLTAGVKAHINSKHRTHGQGPIGQPAVAEHSANQPPTLQARWESHQPGGKANGGTTARGSEIRQIHAVSHTAAQLGSVLVKVKTREPPRELTNSSSQRFKQWSDGARYTGYEQSGLLKVKTAVNTHGDLLDDHGDFLGKSTGAVKASPTTRSQTFMLSRQADNSGNSMKEAAVTGGTGQKATGVREVTTGARGGRANYEPRTTTSERGVTKGASKASRDTTGSTLPTGYVRPRAGKVKSPVSNHGDFLNNHGDFLGESAVPARPSPMTRSQTGMKQIPLYNDGSSRVRGLEERSAIQKARYARECEGKKTAILGILLTENPPARVQTELRDNIVELADVLPPQSTATCPWEYGDRSHRVAQDIMEAGPALNCHCMATPCRCMAKPVQTPAEAVEGNANVDNGEAAEDDKADYAYLVAEFHRGAYYKHHSWKDPLRAIVLTLLHECVEEDEVRATEGIAALQLLPGLVEYCRGQRNKKVGTPIQLLRDIQGSPDRPREILRLARSWAQKIQAHPSEWPQPSVEKMRTRIESLAATGRLSAAATALQSMEELMKGHHPPPAASAEEIARRIAELHPPEDERDVLPDEADDPPVETAFQLTADQVRQRFYTIQQKNTAAGCTGWSNEWLRLIGDDRTDPEYTHTVTPPSLMHVAFSAFFNKILQGRVTGEGRELLVTARLIMIPKPQGGLRPIRIECAIMRLMSATAAALARVIIAPTLRPIQLGGGLRCGVEIGARLLDAAYSRDDTVISVDITNAFNSTRHRVMWDGLAEKFPSILRYFRMKHGTPSRMIGNDGKVVAWTRTGVGQGDPWGGLFFEVGVHPALLELAEKVKKVETYLNHTRSNPILRPGAVSAYEDDTQIRGEQDVMFAVAPHIKGIFGKHGFEVNVSKSTITGTQSECYDPPEDFRIASNGLIALGVPVGNLDFTKDIVTSSVKSMEPPAAALQLLKPRTAVQLLAHCINPKPAFLLRTATNMEVIQRAAAQFDDSMVAAIAAVFRLPITVELANRVFLPLRFGGFGLTRHYGMATEKNQILSRTAYIAFLTQHHPSELEAAQNTFSLSVVRLGCVEGLEAATEITGLMMETLTEKTCSAVLGTGMRKAQKKIYANMHIELLAAGQYSKAAWFLSAATSSTAYLLSTAGMEYEQYFGVAEFRCAGRNTLGFGPLDATPGERRTCHCGYEYALLEEPFHGMSCANTKGYRTKRHNEIRDLLFKLVKKRHPAVTPQQLQVEANVGQYAGGERGVRADITWVHEAEKLIIDIMVIDPGCQTYVKPPVLSFQSNERAAVWAENIKRNHYSKVVIPAKLNAHSVIPFVVEASGRLGPAALAFVNRVCGTQSFIKSTFLREISMITARSTGRMLKATRDQYKDVR
jgi:hypothetical protein